MTLPLTLNSVLGMAPGLPTDLAQIVLDEWIETGDWQLALAAMRSSPTYDQHFPGNRRPDGSLRYDEATYFSLREDFAAELTQLNVNPDLFRDKFVQLMEGEVSPTEWRNRLAEVNEQVLLAGDATRQWFGQQFGLSNLTNSAIIAAVLDPELSAELVQRRITVAQIGAQAQQRDLGIAIPQVTRLIEGGITSSAQAAELFGQAASTIPMLQRLIERHFDPGDEFGLDQFIDAAVYDDQEELTRIARLLAQERSEFSEEDQFEISDGAVTGLTPA